MLRSILRHCVLPLSLLLSAGVWASDTFWIDVRTPEEYATDHLTVAVNIPYEEIGARIGEVTADKEALIYLYCRSGRRAGIAQETLNQQGYVNVVNLETLEKAEAKYWEPPAK